MRRGRKNSWGQNNVLQHEKRRESEGGKNRVKKIVMIK
jgi:hypothetical protein